MKRYFRGLFLLCAASLGITGCSLVETQFANSPYGSEIESMMKTCMVMKENGLLPGLDAGEDKSLELTSDGIDFSERNTVNYPIQLNCVVISHDQERSFPFTKQSSNSEWKLSE